MLIKEAWRLSFVNLKKEEFFNTKNDINAIKIKTFGLCRFNLGINVIMKWANRT